MDGTRRGHRGGQIEWYGKKGTRCMSKASRVLTIIGSQKSGRGASQKCGRWRLHETQHRAEDLKNIKQGTRNTYADCCSSCLSAARAVTCASSLHHSPTQPCPRAPAQLKSPRGSEPSRCSLAHRLAAYTTPASPYPSGSAQPPQCAQSRAGQ
jgi:hypothetical protein